MKRKLIALLLIGIALIGLTGAVSANNYGVFTSEYNTLGGFNLMIYIVGGFDVETGFCQDPEFGMPTAYEMDSYTSGEVRSRIYVPTIEERRMEVPEVPEAYSLREDLPDTDMPGVFIGRRLGP